MEKYQQFRELIIDICKQKKACQSEFKRLLATETPEAFVQVLKDNFQWCCENEVLTGTIIDQYGLRDYSIRHNEDAEGGHILAWGSATVMAWGSATVRAWGSATVEASGSATVRAWGSAYVHAPYNTIECTLSEKAILRHGDTIKSATKEMKLD